jgi:hypothetical protein
MEARHFAAGPKSVGSIRGDGQRFQSPRLISRLMLERGRGAGDHGAERPRSEDSE